MLFSAAVGSLGGADVSVLLQKHGDRVRFGATRAYSIEAVRIVDEARAEQAERKRQGYGRSDALADFESFQRDRHLTAVSRHYSFKTCDTVSFLEDLRQALSSMEVECGRWGGF